MVYYKYFMNALILVYYYIRTYVELFELENI